MVRWSKLGIMLAVVVVASSLVTGTASGEQAAPDVMVNAHCPQNEAGMVSVSVDPWLFEGQHGETSTWILTVNNKQENQIVIAAPFGDPERWPFEEGSYSGHGRIDVAYDEVDPDRTDEVFEYTITVDCQDAGLRVVIDPQIKIHG